MILRIILCAIAVIGFSIIFNVPRRELVFCGLAGAGGWTVFTLISNAGNATAVLATFFAAMTVTLFARFLSTLRKMPSTLYIIPGIIPLVPGSLLYATMFYAVNGDHGMALTQGIEALSRAGVIALGLLVVLSLPRRMFNLERRRVKS